MADRSRTSRALREAPRAGTERRRRSRAPATALLLGLAGCGRLADAASIAWHGPSGIDDARLFASRPLHANPTPFRFRELASERLADEVTLGGEAVALSRALQDNDTVAFVVVRGDALLYERYFRGFERRTPSLVFSVTKSITSLAAGCAEQDGLLSAGQPVTDLLPGLRANGFEGVTLEHLLHMTSGSDYRHSDAPWGDNPWFYYGTDLPSRLGRLRVEGKPGAAFAYKNGDTELLGLALSRALAPRTLTSYLQERIWTPLGMEHSGAWSLDHADGQEKTSCCLSATAVDLAKIGRLYARGGNWEGRQVVSATWVERSTRPGPVATADECADLATCDTSEALDHPAWYYRYQWWIVSRQRGDFLASGHLGQYLYVDPARSVVVVRLGRSLGSLSHRQWRALLVDVASRVP